MTDPIERRLDADGDRWRASLAHPPSLDEALTRLDSRRHRPRVWLIAAASVLVVVAAALIPLLVAHHRDSRGSTADSIVPQPSAPLVCPAAADQSPPATPRRPAGVDGHTHLVPDTTPTRAVVCAYDYGSGTAASLTGSKVLSGDLATLRDTLYWVPPKLVGEERACTAIGNSRTTGYLVGLNYPDGIVWVSTASDANSCVDTTNGDFTSPVFLGSFIGQWYSAGARPPPLSPPTSSPPCDFPSTGRWGQQVEMVPAGLSSLTICTSPEKGGTGAPKATDATAESSDLRKAFNEPRTHATQAGCSGRSGKAQQFWELEFGYPTGPPVVVRVVSNCDPEVSNGSLQSAAGSDLITLIEAATR